MKFKNLYGKDVSKSITKYLVKWDKPCRSKVQSKIKNFFQQYWDTHIVVEEFPVFGSRMKCDLINLTKKIAVETHGMQHDKFVKHFHHTKTGFKKSIKRDMLKYNWLESNGFQIIEIFENEIDLVSREWIEKKFNISI